MKINFKEITLQNFLSYKEKQLYQFNNSGISLLSGINGNGKTTIPSAIYFVLFGKSDRGKLNDLINLETGKNLEVTLTLSINNDEYKIIRGLKPSKFEIFKNGKKLNKEASVKNQQKKLLEILNLNETIFFQMIYLGTSLKDTKNFFELSQKEKESVLNILIDTSHFNIIRDNAKEYLKFLKQEKSKLEYGLSILKSDVQNIKNTISKQEKQNKEIIENKNQILKEILNEISNYENEIKAREEKVSKKDKVKDKIIELQKILDEKNKELLVLKNLKNSVFYQIKLYEDNEKNKIICPKCGTEIKNEIKLEKPINELKQDLEILNEKISTLENEIFELNSNLKKYTNGLEKLKHLEYEIINFNNLINELKNKYESIKNTKKIEIDYSLLENKIAELEEVEKKVIQITSKMEEVMELIDLLSEDNLKGTYIEKFLPILNFHLNHYLEKLNLPIVIKINKNLKETIFYENKEISYLSLSAGQKMRVIVALLFTFLKIIKIKNNIDFNVLFLDEFINGSLDTEGVEATLNGLLEFSNDKEIILITHNNDIKQMDEIFSNIYEIIKSENGSKIIKK